MEDEDGIFPTWKGFVKNYLKLIIVTKNWIWKDCFFFILEHHLFMKKDKLVHETILLDVANFMLHHLAHAKFAKDSWDNLCATFEKKYVGYKLQLRQKLLRCNKFVQIQIIYQITNFKIKIFIFIIHITF